MSVKILVISTVFVLFAVGCSERPPLTNDEKWQKFCTAYEVSSYYIMSDRQHDVEFAKALEHVEKLPEGQERNMMIDLVKAAHQSPKYDQQADKQKSMDEFKAGKYQACMQQPAS